MRLHYSIATASWLAVCVIAPVAIAQEITPTQATTVPHKAEAEAPAAAPKPPQLEKLAEKEAMQDVWQQLTPAQREAALEHAKKQLEAQPPKAPRITGNKEEDAIRGALKRIKQLPVSQRDTARRELRTCLDRIVPPPGMPQTQKPANAADMPVVAPVKSVHSTPAAVKIQPTPGCRLRKAVAGCR